MRKTQQGLGERGGQRAHEEHGAEHQDEAKDLWDQEGPVRGGGGVDDVGKATLAIAPDKFASVVDGHQDDHETEGALQQFDHAQGDGQENGPVLLQAQEDAAQGIDEPQHDENAKGWAVKDLAGLKAGPVKGLNPLGQQPLLRRRDPRRGRRGGGAGCRQGHLGGIPPGLCRATSPGLEAEYQAGGGQGDQPQAGPQQPVGEKHPSQLGKPGVGLEGGVVTGRLAHGDGTERIQPGGELAHFIAGGEGSHDDPEDQQGSGTDIGRHH